LKVMRFYIVLLFLAFASFHVSCSNKNQKVHVVSTEVYKEIINDTSLRLIDVRTPEECEQGALPGAINIDYFDEENFYKAYDAFDRKELIYLYCRTGNRSVKTAEKLIEMGCEEIYDMEGGYVQWTKDLDKE